MRLKVKDIPVIRAAKLRAQEGVCPLCEENISTAMRPCLDHDHNTGNVRDVLCANCNRMEGEIFNRCRRAKRSLDPHQWAANLLEYWRRHKDKPSGVFHPQHKTQDERRELTNAKRRAKAAAVRHFRNLKAKARRQAKRNIKRK